MTCILHHFQDLKNKIFNFQNVGMDVPLSGSVMVDQPLSSNNSVMSQGMVPLNTAATVTSNHASNSSAQSADRCLSPVQQPDSTTDLQQSVSDSRLHLDPSLCNHTPQFLPYNNSPAVITHPPVVRPDGNGGNINPPSCLSETSCASNVPSQHVVNMSYATVSGGSDQQSRDVNANVMFQPVNFMAQKSMQISGSDLPLSGKYNHMYGNIFIDNAPVWRAKHSNTVKKTSNEKNRKRKRKLLPKK